MSKRKPHWRQNTPQMQIEVLLGAIKGNVSNLVEGFGERYTIERRIEKFSDEIKEISTNYISNSWD